MFTKRIGAVILACVAVGCSAGAPSTDDVEPASEEIAAPAVLPAPATPAAFVNRVWRIAASEQVETGALRVFLSDGTMVMTSPNSTPAFGTWAWDDGRMTITEEGQSYDVEILELGAEVFRISISSPGDPVVIRFEPADPSAGRGGEIRDETPPAGSVLEDLPALAGIWTIVSHHAPGVSAMTDAEAREHQGRTIRLVADGAHAMPNRCAEPAYTARDLTISALLAEYNLQPGSLDPLAPLDRVRVLETMCYGSPWTGPGSRLIGIDASRALVPWDGVFFEVVRDRDERAVGQEPFWNLQILKGRELRFTFDMGERTVVVPDSGPVIDEEHGVRQYHDMTDVIDLRVVVRDLVCSDAMSGRPYPHTVSVTLNGQTYDGCGGAVP